MTSSPDLFDQVQERQAKRSEIEAMRSRILSLERENMNMRILLANALSALRPRWDIQARAVRKNIREAI